MANEAPATCLDRRGLLLGGAVAGTATALGMADKSDAHESAEDEGAVLIGRISRRHASGGVELETEDGGSVVVHPVPGAEIVESDGSPKKLSDFAIGDGIAVDFASRAGGRAAAPGGTVGARRITPCVLGSRSDVKR